MICKCGKECDGPAFSPTRQDWEYGTPRSPYLLYEVCEHGAVTVDNRPVVTGDGTGVALPPIDDLLTERVEPERKGRR
jgi:hypothetical protein